MNGWLWLMMCSHHLWILCVSSWVLNYDSHSCHHYQSIHISPYQRHRCVSTINIVNSLTNLLMSVRNHSLPSINYQLTCFDHPFNMISVTNCCLAHVMSCSINHLVKHRGMHQKPVSTVQEVIDQNHPWLISNYLFLFGTLAAQMGVAYEPQFFISNACHN